MTYTENIGGLKTAVRFIFFICLFLCFIPNSVDSSPLNSKKVSEGIVSIIFIFPRKFIILSESRYHS